MRRLIIRKSETHPSMWVFEDSHRPSSFSALKRDTLYHFSRLRELKTYAHIWQQVNGDMAVVIEDEGESMLLSCDEDWAFALLRFGP